MAYVVWTVSKSRTWHIWSVLVDLRWFWSATQNKLPCGVIFSLNVSWNALFQFEIIFKIYEWSWWSLVVHFHLVSRIYNLELAFNDQCVCVWMATLSVFSGSGPLGQQFLMICSSWPGKHPLTFFPLVFILFFFSPRVQDVLWHSRLHFAVQFSMRPWNEQAGDVRAPLSNAHSVAASYFCGDTKSAAERIRSFAFTSHLILIITLCFATRTCANTSNSRVSPCSIFPCQFNLLWR